MGAYTVHAKRWERGWELHITDAAGAEVGVTQTDTPDQAEAVVRDYLAQALDVAPDSFELIIRFPHT